MLNLKEADMTQTRFYQEVLQIGRQEGRQEGLQQEVNLILRLLTHRCGEISIEQQNQVRSLPIASLETLGEALLDFQGITDLENWLRENT
jgi:predicted transposase YdaD